MGLLDSLPFMDDLKRFAAARDGAPDPTVDPGVTEVDYSQGVPLPFVSRKKATELEDEDLKKFRERNPIVPNPNPGTPVGGMLGPNIQQNAPGAAGAVPYAPPQPSTAAPLPPPVDVPPPPAVAQTAPPAAPAPVPAGGPPTDISAQSRRPPVPPAAPDQPQGLLQRFDQFTQQHPGLLFGLASGFAGAGSIGSGMRAGFAGAAEGSQADQKTALQTSAIASTYRALVASGVKPQIALAAAQNPGVLAQVAPDYLGTRKAEIKSIKSKDAFGNETERLVSVNPYDNTVQDVTPKGGAGGGAGGTPSGGAVTTYAPGITPENFNAEAVGDDYLKQFSPTIQAGVHAYLRGDSLPTGRQQQMQVIKQIAQKYGDDIGVPANDQAYYARKAFQTSLGDTKSGVGLQAKGFSQGLEHAVSLSNNLVKLGNVNGLGLEPVANATNWAKNFTTGQTSIKNAIDADSQALAGEIGKLYSGGTGGGVHEREATKVNLGKTSQSPIAAAGGLEATIDLMEGGLRTLEQRRDALYPGKEKPAGSDFNGPYEQKLMQQLRDNIAILKGEKKAAAGTSRTGATGSAPVVPWKVITP